MLEINERACHRRRMRVSSIQKDHSLRVEERSQPNIHEDEILLKVKACGLCGTDILKVYKKSAAEGTVLGHEVAGIVEDSRHPKFRKGDRVVVAHHVPCFECHFCKHENYSMCSQFKKTNLDPGGFAEYLRIPREHADHTAFQIPEGLSFEEASFMEPLACCLRAVKRSRLSPGDSCLVVGLGSIGLLLAQLLRHFGVHTFATDLIDSRMELARSFGAEKFSPEKLRSLPAQGVDMLLFTAGNEALLNTSLSWVRDGGKIHLFSSLAGGEHLKFDFNQVYHRELEVFSTYSSAPLELRESLDLLSLGQVSAKPLISNLIPLSDIPWAIDQTQKQQILKAIVIP